MIRIVTFGPVRREYVDVLIKKHKEVFESDIELLNPGLELPKKGYSKKREQHTAETFIEELLDVAEGDEIVLGITESDIYTDKMNFVFGQAQLGGQAAIISLKRLDPEYYGMPAEEKVLNERILKEAVHEIGHCLGLTHCDDPKCNMVFSNNVYDVDSKSAEFCDSCVNRLVE
jgi:archaemetzincin